MRNIVTGGAGFIGSNLSESLLNYGEVKIIDDLSTGRFENIRDLVERDGVEFVNSSVTNVEEIRPHFKDVDHVFHLAALPNVIRSVRDPLRSNEVNITGTLNVLISSRDNGVRKVIYASSSSVYGEAEELPKREDFEPKPKSPYALTKLTGEHYCRIFTDLYDLNTVCLRYFNVYGPRQDSSSEYSAVIPIFINSLMKGITPVIYGDGEQTRDFTYVKDAVRANILAMTHDVSGIVNIAGGKQTSINQLYRMISDIIGVDIEPVYADPRPGDVRHSLADISRAEQCMGFVPEYDVERGLEETVEWYRR